MRRNPVSVPASDLVLHDGVLNALVVAEAVLEAARPPFQLVVLCGADGVGRTAISSHLRGHRVGCDAAYYDGRVVPAPPAPILRPTMLLVDNAHMLGPTPIAAWESLESSGWLVGGASPTRVVLIGDFPRTSPGPFACHELRGLAAALKLPSINQWPSVVRTLAERFELQPVHPGVVSLAQRPPVGIKNLIAELASLRDMARDGVGAWGVHGAPLDEGKSLPPARRPNTLTGAPRSVMNPLDPERALWRWPSLADVLISPLGELRNDLDGIATASRIAQGTIRSPQDLSYALSVAKQRPCVLAVYTDRSWGSLHLADGKIVAGALGPGDEGLGAFAVQRGLAPEAEIAAAVERARLDGISTGAALRALGIEDALVSETMIDYVLYVVESIMRWPQAQYAVVTHVDHPAPDGVPIAVGVEAALMAAFKVHDEESRMLAAAGGPCRCWRRASSDVPSPVVDAFDFDISPVLELLTGELSIEAVALHTRYPLSLVAQICVKLAEAGLATEDAENAPPLQPSVEAQVAVGLFLLRLGLTPSALERFVSVLAEAPKHVLSSFAVAYIKACEGDLTDALQRFSGLTTHAKYGVGAYLNAAVLESRIGRPARTREVLATLPAVEQLQPPELLARATAALEVGAYPEADGALDAFMQAVSSAERPPLAYFLLGNLMLAGARLVSASDDSRRLALQANAVFAEGVAAHPHAWPLLGMHAFLWWEAGDPSRADVMIRRALALQGGEPWLHALAGSIAFDAGRFDEATRALQQVRALAPNHGPETYLMLSRMALARGDVESATLHLASARGSATEDERFPERVRAFGLMQLEQPSVAGLGT